ncbi:hypothetical protein HaLaN_26656 [Haematococcus lacustris]|uniref:Uncharacterized protein n=1 Tax=Haematococcus lacustris TaxID=44745 RepID=A0A6A0A760_HAELA|nr:hypothetical protein HaLaN_26656 [Haematococcus lacustris]
MHCTSICQRVRRSSSRSAADLGLPLPRPDLPPRPLPPRLPSPLPPVNCCPPRPAFCTLPLPRAGPVAIPPLLATCWVPAPVLIPEPRLPPRDPRPIAMPLPVTCHRRLVERCLRLGRTHTARSYSLIAFAWHTCWSGMLDIPCDENLHKISWVDCHLQVAWLVMGSRGRLRLGLVPRKWEWELSKGQLRHDSELTKAKRDTARWSAAIQPQLQQLAAATPAVTTLEGLQPTSRPSKPTRVRCERSISSHGGAGDGWGCTIPSSASLRASARSGCHGSTIVRGVAVYLAVGCFNQGARKAKAVRDQT